jgi:uncharacterized repeat protein (TIGR01451 family)
VPNNTYGWGRIQAEQAYQMLQHTLQIEKTARPVQVHSGEMITYTLTTTHTQPAGLTSGVIITDVVPADTTFISATQPYTLTGSLITWNLGSLGPASSRSVELVVQVLPNAASPILNANYGARSDQAPPATNLPVSVPLLKYSVYLPTAFYKK